MFYVSWDTFFSCLGMVQFTERARTDLGLIMCSYCLSLSMFTSLLPFCATLRQNILYCLLM